MAAYYRQTFLIPRITTADARVIRVIKPRDEMTSRCVADVTDEGHHCEIKNNNISGILTEHFAILRELRYNIEHVFRLHHLQKTQQLHENNTLLLHYYTFILIRHFK